MDRLTLGPDLLKDLKQFVSKVLVNLKESQELQKSYMEKKRKDKYYQIGDHVYLKVKEKRSSLNLGRCGKLAPRFLDPLRYWPREGQWHMN